MKPFTTPDEINTITNGLIVLEDQNDFLLLELIIKADPSLRREKSIKMPVLGDIVDILDGYGALDKEQEVLRDDDGNTYMSLYFNGIGESWAVKKDLFEQSKRLKIYLAKLLLNHV